MRLTGAIAIAGTLLLAAASAHADFVTNGGFESGLAGWTPGAWSLDNSTPHSGSFDATTLCFSNCTDPGNGLSQTIADNAGANYSLSFWFDPGNKSLSNITLLVDLNGSQLYTENFAPSAAYVQRSVSFVGTGSDTLSFLVDPGVGQSFLDDVSVVPEPASLTLLSTALVGLALRRRRRAA